MMLAVCSQTFYLGNFRHVFPVLYVEQPNFFLWQDFTMPPFKSYTYIQCPCTDTSVPAYQLPKFSTSNPSAGAKTDGGEEQEEEGQTFDPRAPRSNYSLYPLEHLLYCEDCHEIRCPKCALDEIVTWYCPNCLFEVPSSTVKSEGNRYELPTNFHRTSTIFML